ncbi:MAG: transketolase C-terminal domain-containing protein, partial [Campylobacterota bacterium]|nr:transketolase C-terminal domain-containing protein [Campylobacterota bacterium]
AKEGFKPFITIYSTFLQRGFDQIIHDVCLMNLPVVFTIDRAGIVGNDGETHQGTFDISFLRFIPNMILLAPRDSETLHYALQFTYTLQGPSAVRYPRGAFKQLDFQPTQFTLGKGEILKEGSSDKLFIGYGAGVGRAIDTEVLHDEDITIVDLRFVKPLDAQLLKNLANKYAKWYIFSDSQAQGGVGSALLEFLNKHKIHNIELTTFEYEDIFIQHGDTKVIEEELGLLPEQLVKQIQ